MNHRSTITNQTWARPRPERWLPLAIMMLALACPNPSPAQTSPTPATMLSHMQQHSQGHPDWTRCQAGDGVGCFRFIRSAVQAANPGCDPAGWGLLSKQAGENQCTQEQCGSLGGEGFAIDAITWQAEPGVETVYDTVQGAGGPNPQLQMLEVQRRPRNRWACPWSEIASVPNPQNVYAGRPYTHQLMLNQAAPPITWSVQQGPAGLQVDTNGLVSGWMPNHAQAGSAHTVHIQASNAKGTHSATWQVRVTWPGDNNFDFDVDQDDFSVFQMCYSGTGIPHPSGCEWADLDRTGDVAADDFNLFLNCMNGTNQPPDC